MAVDALTQKESKLEPAWEIAHLFPLQGAWSEADYLAPGNQSLGRILRWQHRGDADAERTSSRYCFSVGNPAKSVCYG